MSGPVVVKAYNRLLPLLSKNIHTTIYFRKDSRDDSDSGGTRDSDSSGIKNIAEDFNKIPNKKVLEELKRTHFLEPPTTRAVRQLKSDVNNFLGIHGGKRNQPIFPNFTDVVIIGGGAIGSSIAYWLKERASDGLSVTVVEKDPSYSAASTTLSVGGLRQQFCLPESVEMSLFGAEFIRTMKRRLMIGDDEPPDPQFQPYGYLFLASEKGAEVLRKNSKMQIELGARNVLLSPAQLRNRFPWLRTHGIELGCLGLENEGWFDPWSLLSALKNKSISLGAQYVHGEVIEFGFDPLSNVWSENSYEKLDHLIVRLPDGSFQKITFAMCVIAAGAHSGEVAKMAKIGIADGLRSTPLPIEPRKRFVYVVHCPDGPGLNTPLTVEPGGVYFRREGLVRNFVCGCSPASDEEPSCETLDVDYAYFDKKVWPCLADRVPCFENAKLKNAWAGYYEYNTLDANGVVGRHPYYHNLFIAAGFSGHGIQHAPAVGRGLVELMLDQKYKTLNLSRLGFERLIKAEPLLEQNIW